MIAVKGTGAIPSPASRLASAPHFDQWARDSELAPIVEAGAPIDLSHFLPSAWDQGESSACCGFGFAAVLSAAFGMAGQDSVAFDPWWLYGLANEGRDGGASPWAVAKAIATVGALPLKPCTDPAAPSVALDAMLAGRGWPDADWQAAYQWRVPDMLYIGGWGVPGALSALDQIHHSLDLGRPVALGLRINRRFARVGKGGVAGSGGGTAGGHLMAVVGRAPVLYRGREVAGLKVRNSWGPGWGEAGSAWLVPAHFKASAWVEAVSVAAVDPPGDPPIPSD